MIMSCIGVFDSWWAHQPHRILCNNHQPQWLHGFGKSFGCLDLPYNNTALRPWNRRCRRIIATRDHPSSASKCSNKSMRVVDSSDLSTSVRRRTVTFIINFSHRHRSQRISNKASTNPNNPAICQNCTTISNTIWPATNMALCLTIDEGMGGGTACNPVKIRDCNHESNQDLMKVSTTGQRIWITAAE